MSTAPSTLGLTTRAEEHSGVPQFCSRVFYPMARSVAALCCVAAWLNVPLDAPAAPPPAPASASTPCVAAGWVASPPAIDGRVAGDEWLSCAAFVGYRCYVTHRLAEPDVTTFCGYDDTHLYLCFVLPLESGTTPSARVTEHDGPVYREDAVEVILSPAGADADDIRQIIVNALGTVFDRRGARKEWGGSWRIAAGKGTQATLPSGVEHSGEFWCIEMALPFADLGVPMPKPGETWRVNFCVDGQRPLVLAPTFESYLVAAKFASLVFLGRAEPLLSLVGLGKISYGRLALRGRAHNPTAENVTFQFRFDAEKKGTETVERTGFDEIVGSAVQWQQAVTLPPGTSQELALSTQLNEVDLDVMRLTVAARSETGASTQLYANECGFRIMAPLRLVVENYPSGSYLVVWADATGYDGSIDGAQAVWSVIDASGKKALGAQFALTSRRQSFRVDCQALPVGAHALRCRLLDASGRECASAEQRFSRAAKPVWLDQAVGKSRVVLPPFTPMRYAERTVSMWGRTMVWSEASVLPCAIEATGVPLLAGPISLVVTVAGDEQVLRLDQFEFSARDPDRGEMRMAGRSEALVATLSAWAEYDGLLWSDLTLRSVTGRAVPLDACRIEIPLTRHSELYYHGVPERSMSGRIGESPLEFGFQHYFWVGSCERGLGFVIESSGEVSPGADGTMFRLLPRDGSVLWQIQLIERRVAASDLRYAFGLQATPVRPLPPDYHSWLTANLRTSRDSAFDEFRENIDFATIWEQFRGKPENWWREAFCDPVGVRTEKVKALVADAHATGIPALLYYAPMNFTDDVRQVHTDYACEWMVAPRTRWKAAGFTQTRACSRSSFPDWLLYHLQRTVADTGLDGLYFDGTTSGPCKNRHHGCGWLLENGKVERTLPVLQNREFNKRVATMLYETVEPRGIDSPASRHRRGWPRYYNWVHISGAVCPPMLSFNTAYFCGEWFKGAIKRGRSYTELLTLDTFRTRYLSTPWGVPNFFLPITRELKSETSSETECILAYLLPHGVPLYPKYLNLAVRRTVLRAMTDFDTRAATFTPAWQKNPALTLRAPGRRDILLGSWTRDGRVLAVVANLSAEPVDAHLEWAQPQERHVRRLFPEPENPGARTRDGGVPLSIGPHTFQLLLVEEKSRE